MAPGMKWATLGGEMGWAADPASSPSCSRASQEVPTGNSTIHECSSLPQQPGKPSTWQDPKEL